MDKLFKDIHKVAKEKGWWDSIRSTGECIALMHSELSEALESARHDDAPDDKITDMPGTLVELADCVIRIADYCEYRGWDLLEAMKRKHEYNKDRPYKHGKKF